MSNAYFISLLDEKSNWENFRPQYGVCRGRSHLEEDRWFLTKLTICRKVTRAAVQASSPVCCVN